MEKWLILGWSDTIRQIAQAVTSSPFREITGVLAESQQFDDQFPVVSTDGLPESILLKHDPDVILCGHHDTFDIAPLARLAVQSETTLIIEHGSIDSIVSFELEMLRHEATGIIESVFPFTDTSVFTEFKTFLQNQEITHLSIDETSSSSFTIEEAIDRFAHTHPAVTALQGPAVQINAVTTTDEKDGHFRTILVTVANDTGSIATWCLTQSNHPQSIEVAVTTSTERHTLLCTAESTSIDGVTVESGNGIAESTMDRLLQPLSHSDVQSNWIQSAKIMDAAENIPVSIRRKRTIPIHGDLPTEHDTFKGVMSMVGCFTLLIILGVIFVFVLVDVYYLPQSRQEASDMITQQSHMTPEDRTPFFLRIWPVYPLVILLLMQFLKRCIRPKA